MLLACCCKDGQDARCISARGCKAYQLVAAAQSSDNRKVRGRRDEEKTESGENLTELSLRCQVDAHGHVVEDHEGDERCRNLQTAKENT